MIARVLRRADNDVKNHWNSKEFSATRERLEQADILQISAIANTFNKSDNVKSPTVHEYKSKEAPLEVEESCKMSYRQAPLKSTFQGRPKNRFEASFENYLPYGISHGSTEADHIRLNNVSESGNGESMTFERTKMEYSQNSPHFEAKKTSKITDEKTVPNLRTRGPAGHAIGTNFEDDHSFATSCALICTPVPKKGTVLCHSLINSASVFHRHDYTPTTAPFRGRAFFSPNLPSADSPSSDFYDMSTPFGSGESLERVAV
mmetsp:Transcript_16411/g.24194  ORF Transcript_16411/g.24194 Transcript_16411/m.24194 type:complete len:261 (+) Transcript_16411:378-1160(+)